MIPDEAVEAAARAIYERKFGPEGWDGLPDKPRKQYADEARFILEAAAPHVAAEAWDAGAKAQAAAYGMEKDTGPNPHEAKA